MDYGILIKKGLVITFTVALLGLVGLYNSKNSTAAQPNAVRGQSSGSLADKGTSSNRSYKNGSYTGSKAETPYGPVQVEIIITGGKIADIDFLRMPHEHGHSRQVTAMSQPLLKQSTLKNQSVDLDFISGATSTVYGYQESLQAALDKAAGSALISASDFQSARGLA
jgi:uncharacterized protein with FMN-binding domain